MVFPSSQDRLPSWAPLLAHNPLLFLRIHYEKVQKPHTDCTNTEEKSSASVENKLKVGVSCEQFVYNRVPAIPMIGTSAL